MPPNRRSQPPRTGPGTSPTSTGTVVSSRYCIPYCGNVWSVHPKTGTPWKLAQQLSSQPGRVWEAHLSGYLAAISTSWKSGLTYCPLILTREQHLNWHQSASPGRPRPPLPMPPISPSDSPSWSSPPTFITNTRAPRGRRQSRLSRLLFSTSAAKDSQVQAALATNFAWGSVLALSGHVSPFCPLPRMDKCYTAAERQRKAPRQQTCGSPVADRSLRDRLPCNGFLCQTPREVSAAPGAGHLSGEILV